MDKALIMNKIVRISWLVIASCLLLGAQQGVQMVIMAGPTGAVPLNPCLISGWPMNEGSGTTINDISGNLNTVTIHQPGQITWGTNAGFPGSSLTITGTNPQMSATSSSLTNFTGTAPFSLAAWISITSVAANMIILSSSTNAGTYNGWEIGATSNHFYFFLFNTNTTNGIVVNGSTNVQNTGKHYVVATYDGSRTAAGVKLYVDGSLETPSVGQNNLSLTAVSGIPPDLGERPADQNTMLGILAAPAIYNCVLTSGQITTYNGLGPQIN